MEAIDYKSQPTQILYLLNQATNISAENLANAIGSTKRGVRDIIHDLRVEGNLIGSGDDGYYLIKSVEEFERFKAKEMSSINNRLKPLQAMERAVDEKWGTQGELNFE